MLFPCERLCRCSNSLFKKAEAGGFVGWALLWCGRVIGRVAEGFLWLLLGSLLPGTGSNQTQANLESNPAFTVNLLTNRRNEIDAFHRIGENAILSRRLTEPRAGKLGKTMPN